MKNQSFHPRKIRLQETRKPNYDELKARTINALNKLGQQKFSTESGGYSLDNWVKGVNMLLDEFEEEVGRGWLTPVYLERRRQLNDDLSNPVSTSSLDEEISDLRQKVADAKGRIDSERARIASKVTDLKDEQSRCSAELAREQSRVASGEAVQNSDSIFRRLLRGNPKPAATDPEMRVKELQSRFDAISSEILDQQRLLKSIDQLPVESPLAETWNELQSSQASLDVLEVDRLRIVHFDKEREEITTLIAEAISTMPPVDPKPASTTANQTTQD